MNKLQWLHNQTETLKQSIDTMFANGEIYQAHTIKEDNLKGDEIPELFVASFITLRSKVLKEMIDFEREVLKSDAEQEQLDEHNAGIFMFVNSKN